MKKTIFITGATAGFGKAIAKLFAAKEWNLILTGRRKEKLEQLKKELENDKVQVEILAFDVRDFDATEKAINSLSENSKNSIAVLVNNAGLAAGRAPIDEGLLEDWNAMLDTNVKGLLHVSKTIIPFFKTKKSGHIINIGSIAGKEVYPQGNIYCASKHAVDAISKAMRVDLLPHNIKVSNIAPGAAETEFSMVRFKGDEIKSAQVYAGYDPLVAQDIAETVDFIVHRPAHVNINDIVIVPTAQADSNNILRK